MFFGLDTDILLPFMYMTQIIFKNIGGTSSNFINGNVLCVFFMFCMKVVLLLNFVRKKKRHLNKMRYVEIFT